MTIKELILRAGRERSPFLTGRAFDALRFRAHLSHRQSVELFGELTGLDMPAVEALLYEADRETLDGGG